METEIIDNATHWLTNNQTLLIEYGVNIFNVNSSCGNVSRNKNRCFSAFKPVHNLCTL